MCIRDSAENSGLLFWKGVGILLIIVGGKLVLNLISQLTARQIKKSEEMPEMQARRVQTMMTMTRSTFRYVVYGICALMILAQLGFGNAINNLLLSAGIGSLALGIGAQSLIKDVVTGFFMTVSYTHLDVYKRQGRSGPQQRSARPSADRLLGRSVRAAGTGGLFGKRSFRLYLRRDDSCRRRLAGALKKLSNQRLNPRPVFPCGKPVFSFVQALAMKTS